MKYALADEESQTARPDLQGICPECEGARQKKSRSTADKDQEHNRIGPMSEGARRKQTRSTAE